MVDEQIEARGVDDAADPRRDAHGAAPPLRARRHRRPGPTSDHPLPIGHDQTISQPYIVAFMTEALRPAQGARRCWRWAPARATRPPCWPRSRPACTPSRSWPSWPQEARARLARLGYRNVEVRAGDGYPGWPEAGTLRRHHRDGGRAAHPAAAQGAAQGRRAAGDPRRRRVPGADRGHAGAATASRRGASCPSVSSP